MQSAKRFILAIKFVKAGPELPISCTFSRIIGLSDVMKSFVEVSFLSLLCTLLAFFEQDSGM